MSHLNLTPTLSATIATATSRVPQRNKLWRHITTWLRRGWISERRRAERPDRVVPYY